LPNPPAERGGSVGNEAARDRRRVGAHGVVFYVCAPSRPDAKSVPRQGDNRRHAKVI